MSSAAGSAHTANPMLDIANVVAGSVEHQSRIALAQELGANSGTAPDVTSLELTRGNVPLLAESVPRDYLGRSATVAAQTAALMRDHHPDENIRRS